MVKFLKDHWIGLVLLVIAGLWFAFDASVRGLAGSALVGFGAFFTFLGKLLGGGKGIGQIGDAGTKKAIDNDLEVLQRENRDARDTVEGLRKDTDAALGILGNGQKTADNDKR